MFFINNFKHKINTFINKLIKVRPKVVNMMKKKWFLNLVHIVIYSWGLTPKQLENKLVSTQS